MRPRRCSRPNVWLAASVTLSCPLGPTGASKSGLNTTPSSNCRPLRKLHVLFQAHNVSTLQVWVRGLCTLLYVHHAYKHTTTLARGSYHAVITNMASSCLGLLLWTLVCCATEMLIRVFTGYQKCIEQEHPTARDIFGLTYVLPLPVLIVYKKRLQCLASKSHHRYMPIPPVYPAPSRLLSQSWFRIQAHC